MHCPLPATLHAGQAFRAYACETFDAGRSYLKADLSIECGSAAHQRVTALAAAAILLFPVGISVVYLVLMLHARHAILEDRPSALSKALEFLVRDYRTDFFWWELIEAWKKLFLVGFAALILPGSIEQLFIAFLFSLVFLLVVSVAQPFKSQVATALSLPQPNPNFYVAIGTSLSARWTTCLQRRAGSR